MSTLLQKNLARVRLNTYKNPKINKSKLVELGGYGESVQKTPAKALESIGYKKELALFGLTEELITTALVHDIQKKPSNRVKELSLGAEILGMKDAEKQMINIQVNSYSEYSNEELERITKSAD